MTTSVDRADPDGTVITTAETDGTAITTAETDGTAAVQVTVVGSGITADPVTTMASVDPVTMAEATRAEAAATAKSLPAQVTVAARGRHFFALFRVSVT